MRLSFVLLLAGSVGCASVRTLPPREPPARVAPGLPMPTSALAGDQARVVLDVEDGPTEVTIQALPDAASSPAHARFGTRQGCTTPCVLDVPVGRYDLFFDRAFVGQQRGDADTLTLTHGAYVYRRALGKYETKPDWQTGPGLLAIGGLVMVVGGSFAVLIDDVDTGLITAASLISLGSVMALASIPWWWAARRPEQQAGSTTFWSPPTSNTGETP